MLLKDLPAQIVIADKAYDAATRLIDEVPAKTIALIGVPCVAPHPAA